MGQNWRGEAASKRGDDEGDPAMRMSACGFLGLMVCVCGLAGGAEREGGEKEWEAAHGKFVEFVTPIVEEARERLGDPKISWAEVKNELFKKYLPDVRIYVRDGAFSGETKIWAVTKDGRIEGLGDGTWRGVGENKWFAVEKVPGFLKGRKIKVGSAEEAVEVAKLVEKLAGAASYVGMLRLNTKDYTVFDEAFLRWMYGSEGKWKYTGAKKGEGWDVTVEYVGPQPAMIQQPPVYELVVGEGGAFEDLRRR
jgi:hypothetical protein